MNERMFPGSTEQSFLKHNSVLDIIETSEIRKLSDISKLPSEQPPGTSISKDINGIGSAALKVLSDQGINVKKIGSATIARAESGIKSVTGKDMKLEQMLSETNIEGTLAGTLIGGATLSASNAVAGGIVGSMIKKDPLQESAYPRQPARVALDTERQLLRIKAEKEPFTRFVDKRIQHSVVSSRQMLVPQNNKLSYTDNSLTTHIKNKLTGLNKYPKTVTEKFCTEHWNELSSTVVVLILVSIVLMLSHAMYKATTHAMLNRNTLTKELVEDSKPNKLYGGVLHVDMKTLSENLKFIQSLKLPKLKGGVQNIINKPVVLKPHIEKQYTADEMRMMNDSYNNDVF